MSKHETSFTLTTNEVAQDYEAIEIRNPTGSGRRLRILRVCITSGAQFSVFRLRRYDGLATHGTGGDTPDQQTLYAWDSTLPAPAAEIYSGEPDTKLVWSGLTADYDHPFQLDPSDAGDDDKLQPGQYLPDAEQITIEPGTSASISFPEGSETFTVKLLLEEQPEQPVAYMASTPLPAAGAYEEGDWFRIPAGWTSLAFNVTYTADGSATNARPKVRPRWRRGATEASHPIAGSVDVSAPPVALRLQHELIDTINAISASATAAHAFVYDVLAGYDEVRLELAEHGDTSHPGTVVVDLTGS